MTEPTTKPRSPMRVAIAILGVLVVVMAAIVIFLLWGRSNPTVVPSPTPSPSPANSWPPATPSTTPSPTTTPTASSTPTTAATTEAPSPSPSSASATATASAVLSAQTMMWEGRATFEHFTVEVLRDDAGPDAATIEGMAGLLVEVCVTKALDGGDTARISSDPWTLEDSEGTVQTPRAGGYQPAFPADGEFTIGECASGYLTFDYLPAGGNHADLVYENGLGDRAVWQFH